MHSSIVACFRNPFPLNVSAKTVTLYGHADNSVFTQNYRQYNIYNKTRQHSVNRKFYTYSLLDCSLHHWSHAVNLLETCSQNLIGAGLDFANGMRNAMNPKPVSCSFGLSSAICPRFSSNFLF